MFINFNPQIAVNIKTLGSGIKRADETRNYCIYNDKRVEALVKSGMETIPYLKEYLKTSTNENGILEVLAVIDRMADNNPGELTDIYPYLAKFNDTDSPDIQVMLSGIYRKILVPDAFGPLCGMLYKQITAPNSKYFDPKEETGGAILEYLRAYGAKNIYPSDFQG